MSDEKTQPEAKPADAPKAAPKPITDVMLMTFGDEPRSKPAEGYGAPEDVPAEAIDLILDAVKARKITPALIEPLVALLAYFWAKLRSGANPRFASRGTSYGGAEVVAHLEAIRDGEKVEAIPPMIVIQFLMAIFKLIKR